MPHSSRRRRARVLCRKQRQENRASSPRCERAQDPIRGHGAADAFAHGDAKLAAIDAPALGGGLEIALACDLRVVRKGVALGLTESRLGGLAGNGAVRLARLIGPARAKQMLFTGETVTTEVALAWGLVNAVAEQDSALEAARRLASTIAQRGPMSTVSPRRSSTRRTTCRSMPRCQCRPWRNSRCSTAMICTKEWLRSSASVHRSSAGDEHRHGVRDGNARQRWRAMGQGAVLIWNDVADEGRDPFYEWHDKEHVPERLAIPGFRRGRRSTRPSHSPEWFTMYEADDLSVVTSPRYLARLNAPTPATRRTLQYFRTRRVRSAASCTP